MVSYLTYQDVVSELLNQVPAFAARRHTDQSYISHGDRSPYLVFGDFARFLLERLREQIKTDEDEVILQRSFKLLDEMLTSSVPEIINLAQVGVFEALAEHPDALAIARCYLSAEAEVVLDRWLAQWLDWLQQGRD